MASSPINPSNTATATRDAMFLFDLFRESPTPILIQIGPYATKTGAKPNTIIKRLAGIKKRNGLNINTTLGDYQQPATSDDRNIKAEPKQKRVKKEQNDTGDPLGRIASKPEDPRDGKKRESSIGNVLPTPAASPGSSAASASSIGFYQYPPQLQPCQYPQPLPSSVGLFSSPPKRTFWGDRRGRIGSGWHTVLVARQHENQLAPTRTILRLLAAVYAELGEEAFKGRYGRIAKLYGTEATYDAIKSFFAKEVVKMADDLRARSLNFDDREGRGRKRMTHGQQRSGTMQQWPPRLDFDESDDDVIIMSEREVQMEVEERSNPPPARGAMEERACSEEASYDGHDFNPPIHAGSRGIFTHPHDTSHHHHLPSTTPGASTRPQQPPRRASPNKQQQAQQSRKRPYSALLQETDDDDDMRPPSFRYITSRGRQRCALCMTELSSAELLRKHEAMSKLHLANLKDPMVVAKGCATLAQVTQHRPGLAPFHMSGGLDERDITAAGGQQNDQSGASSNSFGRSGSIVLEQGDTLNTTHVDGPGRRRPPPPEQHMNGNADDPPNETSGPAPELEVVQQRTAANKGKQRAQTVPTGDCPVAPKDAPPQPNRHKIPLSVHQQKLQEPFKNGTALPSIHHLLSAGGSNMRATSDDIPPTLLAQILLSSGMELLAKKCIEEHPELREGFCRCILEMGQASGGGDGTEVGTTWEGAAVE